jgi:hypothetical protein
MTIGIFTITAAIVTMPASNINNAAGPPVVVVASRRGLTKTLTGKSGCKSGCLSLLCVRILLIY